MDEGTLQGGSQVLQNFQWGCSKRWGSGGLTDLDFFFGGGLAKRGEVNISGWHWHPEGHYDGFSESDLLWNCQKTNIYFTANISIYIYGPQTFWSFMKFCFVHNVKIVLSLKNSCYAYIPLYMDKTLPTLGNEEEQ